MLRHPRGRTGIQHGYCAVRQAQTRAIRRIAAWLGAPAFDRSHQAALLHKDPVYYGPILPDIPADRRTRGQHLIGSGGFPFMALAAGVLSAGIRVAALNEGRMT